uniref:hypothetical protein n=1 Tax=Neorhizobium sp. EC2-8 TaxID=3129230 RepID=UPI003100E504
MLTTNNHLLKQLSSDDAALLAPLMEQVDLNQDQALFEPLQKIRYVYFFNGGLSSEVAVNADGRRIEVGCVGSEGFSGVPVVLGVDTSRHQSFMQAGASALRIRSADLRKAMMVSPELSSLLLRFAHVFMCRSRPQRLLMAGTKWSSGSLDGC